MILAIANFSFCFAAAKFWQLGCLGDGCSACGRCTGRHPAKWFGFSGNSWAFCMWAGMWWPPVPVPPPSVPPVPAPGTTWPPACPCHTLHRRTQGSTSLSPHRAPPCYSCPHSLLRSTKGTFRDSHILLWPCSTHEKSTAPQRSKRLQIAGETSLSNKYFFFSQQNINIWQHI